MLLVVGLLDEKETVRRLKVSMMAAKLFDDYKPRKLSTNENLPPFLLIIAKERPVTADQDLKLLEKRLGACQMCF
jgi:hypothetical protein